MAPRRSNIEGSTPCPCCIYSLVCELVGRAGCTIFGILLMILNLTVFKAEVIAWKPLKDYRSHEDTRYEPHQSQRDRHVKYVDLDLLDFLTN